MRTHFLLLRPVLILSPVSPIARTHKLHSSRERNRARSIFLYSLLFQRWCNSSPSVMGDGQEKQKVELETKQGRRRLRVKSNNGSWRPGEEHIFGQPPKTITPFSIHTKCRGLRRMDDESRMKPRKNNPSRHTCCILEKLLCKIALAINKKSAQYV